MPTRIQRRRTKGWRMPEGAIYVGRPTKWGNPFWHTAQFHGVDVALALFRSMLHGIWNPSLTAKVANPAIPYQDHADWIKRIGMHPYEALTELRGKDLVCWCALDKPCHADVLLELANK